MSNEQTVREAIEPSVPTWTLEHTCSVLGIDPEMSVAEHQRRLRIAERVLDEADRGIDPEVQEVAIWFTREDDQ